VLDSLAEEYHPRWGARTSNPVRSVKQAWWVRLLPLPPIACSIKFNNYQNYLQISVFNCFIVQ